MNEKDFWIMADNWYIRTKKLSIFWHDKNNPIDKRVKAYLLWQRMFLRLQKLIPHAIRLGTPKFKKEFESGGVFMKNTNLERQ